MSLEEFFKLVLSLVSLYKDLNMSLASLVLLKYLLLLNFSTLLFLAVFQLLLSKWLCLPLDL